MTTERIHACTWYVNKHNYACWALFHKRLIAPKLRAPRRFGFHKRYELLTLSTTSSDKVRSS